VYRNWVLAVGAVALLAGGAFVFLWAHHFFGPVPLNGFEESRLLHQVINLRSYAERESLAGFLPPGDAVISLREEFVQRALDLSLPIRQEFKNGQYEAVLDSAVLRMEDGSAFVELTGRGRRRGDENPDLQVELTVQGYLSAEGIRPEAGTLELGLVVTDVRSASAGPAAIRNWLRPASRYFASLRAEDWNASRYRIEIPVRVDQSIELPAIHGEVRIAGGRVPIAVRTSAVTVYQRRFALSLEFAPRASGQDSVSADSLFHGESPWTRQLEAMVREASRHHVRVSRDALLAERERLFRQVHDLAQRDTLWRALNESDKDVCAVVPDGYLKRLAQQFVTTYLHETDLDVEGDIQAKIDQKITARVLGKEVGAGRISGTIKVLQLTGQLRPAGNIDLDLEPPDRLVCTVPVQAVSGRARIACDIEWEPAFLTGIVCKGFQYTDTLDGVALPFRADLHGVVRLALADSFLVGRTTVRRDRIRVPALPDQASRERVRRMLEGQDRFGRCGIAMDADTTLQRLVQLLKNGVAVRLPSRLFPVFRIPVTMVSDYGAGEFRIHASAQDPEFIVRPTYLRLGFQAGLRVISKEKALPRSGAPSSHAAAHSPQAAAPSSPAPTSGECCSGPAPLRRAPLRSWARTTPGSGPSARSRDPSWSTPGASGACGRPAGPAVHPA
jgi:hypothetical protein